MTFILSFDTWFENLMLAARTPLGLQIASMVTFFGNTMTIIGIAGLIAIALWSTKVYRVYFVGLVTTLGGAAVSGYLMKEVIARARPGGLIQAVAETSYSFPSGHAVASAAFYGFIAFFLSLLYPERRGLIVVVATALILAVGFSRLYLGVHYPSDVLAGFALGGLWLFIGVWITNKIQSHQVTVTEIT